MSDIVEELRKVGELQGDTYSSYEILAMVKQARIEIERLQSCLYAQESVPALYKEIERLRAALEEKPPANVSSVPHLITAPGEEPRRT